ncbi:MAG: phage tail sheath C-terminal domain-containing protein [Pseudomonadota bacterium]
MDTAIPAFIGYTEKAEVDGKPLYNEPIRIHSLKRFVEVFGKGFRPERTVKTVSKAEVQIDPDSYDVSVETADGQTLYFSTDHSSVQTFALFASVKLFFANGGDCCYVTSVGNYTDSGSAMAGVSIDLEKLEAGLAAVGEIVGPTMLVVPDAVYMASDGQEYWQCTDFYKLVASMLAQCTALQDRIALVEPYGSQYLNADHPVEFGQNLNTVISEFRAKLPTEQDLSYGVCYFPFIETSIFSKKDVDYRDFKFSGLRVALEAQAKSLFEGNDLAQVLALIDQADPKSENAPKTPKAIELLDRNLTDNLPVLADMESQLAASLGVLPPCGAMAGVMAKVDADKGVWSAPANVALNYVIAPSVPISSQQQEDLNAPIDGKSVNAIRQLTTLGTVPWGARTLLGNSHDWRYIQVRRTVIYLEQSIKNALANFDFAANDGKTWGMAAAATSTFLHEIWSQGGLLGNSQDEAYTVECGLGSTMTSQDILDGVMVVQVHVAIMRPAEFIVLSFRQKVEGAD